MQKKLERRRRRRGESEERGVELGGGDKEQVPPGEPAPMDKTPSPVDSPHPAGGVYSPGKASPLQRPGTVVENNDMPRASKCLAF